MLMAVLAHTKKIIIKKLIIRYVIISLNYDLSIAPFKIIDTEKIIKKKFITDNGIMLSLKGIIDRIDYTDKLRIVDYKTGNGDLVYSEIEDLFRSDNKKRNRTAFQVLFYSLLSDYKESFYAEPYFLRQLSAGKTHSREIDSKMIEEFSSNLSLLIEEIFDAKVPFTTAKNKDICKYCDFYSICY